MFFGSESMQSDVLKIKDKVVIGTKRSVANIVVPHGVKAIGSYAFSRCSGLTSLTLPNSVKRIGNNAFYGCSGLTSVSLPHGLDTVGFGAFGDCKSLTSVVFRPPVSRGAFIAWAVGNSRHRDNWQLTTLKRLRNVLRLVVVLSAEVRDVSTVDPGGRNSVFRGCTKLIVS